MCVDQKWRRVHIHRPESVLFTELCQQLPALCRLSFTMKV